MRFVIFETDWKSTRRLFDDLDYREDTLSYESMFKDSRINRIFKAHMRGKLAFLPGKGLWTKFIKLPDYNSKEQYIFVYIGTVNTGIAMECGLVPFLRNHFPGSKHVGYYLDIHAAKKVNIEEQKKIFDKLYIFDKIEADKMGIDYYPVPYSKGFSSDVCYVGQDKGRLAEIVKIYDHFSPAGIRCFFYLCNVPPAEQVRRPGIFYGSMMDSEKSLQCIVNTNCVLELKVGDVTSYSDRVQKAIAYNKKILTNNPNLRNNGFFNSDMMLIYDKVEDINPEFVKDTVYKISYGYKDEYSPIHFLEQIEKDVKE